MFASLTNIMNNWLIDILYLVWIMTELWHLFSCLEYQARSNTLNAYSSSLWGKTWTLSWLECIKQCICFLIGIKASNNLTENNKRCSTHLNYFVLLFTNYWKGWHEWRFLLILVCHLVISCLSFFRFMDSDHLFGIFKLFLDIKRKDIFVQA